MIRIAAPINKNSDAIDFDLIFELGAGFCLRYGFSAGQHVQFVFLKNMSEPAGCLL